MAEDTSRIIEEEEGKLLTSAIGFTYAYDRRNSVVDPTAGFILTLNQDFAGLGGDTTYSKTRGTARAYTSLFDEDLVLSAELEGGIIVSDDGTRITDRFNTGGDSFRGFARNGLGPRDFCGDDDEPVCTPPQRREEVNDALGGNYYSVLRLDASFPLGLPEEYGIYGGVFGDVGSLWGLDDIDGSMGQVDDGFHHPLVGRGQPLRRHAVRAAALQLRGAAPVRGLRRARAVPLRGRDPVLSLVAAPRGPGRRGSSSRHSAAPARRRPQAPAAPPFLIINQEQILTGSRAGRRLLAEEERERDALRSRGARARRRLRGRGAPADRAAADAATRPSSAGSPTTSTPAWSQARRDQDDRARRRWRRSLTSAGGRSTLGWRRSW